MRERYRAAVPVILCVLLTAVPGNEAGLVAYEDQVLQLLPAHDGRVVQRVRALDAGEGPYEVHILEFASQLALDGYMQDPRRLALAAQRDASIASTTVIPVTRA
jgi:hypothetical protein